MFFNIKTLEVKPEDENVTVRILSQFGWMLRSSQNIFSSTASTVRAENVIHSVKLIFERDKHYTQSERLDQLENEFWEALTELSKKRPLPPPARVDFHTWAKQNKPSILPLGKKIKIAVITALILHIIISAIILIVKAYDGVDIWNSLYLGSDLVETLIYVPPYISVLSTLLFTALFSKIHFHFALKHPNTIGHPMIRSAYSEYEKTHQKHLDALNRYDLAQKRLNEIIEEVFRLTNHE